MDVAVQVKQFSPYFKERGFLREQWAWHCTHKTDSDYGPLSVNVVRMIMFEGHTGCWWATRGITHANLIRWRSPGFNDPVSAFVYAELNSWGM